MSCVRYWRTASMPSAAVTAGAEAFVAAPSASYASYILALKDLEKR
jgi:hypothetical protein